MTNYVLNTSTNSKKYSLKYNIQKLSNTTNQLSLLTLNYTSGAFYTPILFTQKSMWYCI